MDTKDIIDMTPEELRAFAAEKEQRRAGLMESYMQQKQVPAVLTQPSLKPWERPVEFEGRTYNVDMRKFKTREGLMRMAAIQKSSEQGTTDLAQMVEFMDYAFEGQPQEQARAAAVERSGFEDFEEEMRILGALFEEVSAKN